MPDRISALTPDSIRALHTPEGRQLLDEAASYEDPLAAVTALRRAFPAELVAAALETVDLRRRAGGRIADAGRLFYTREALEQASDSRIAEHRAHRFAPFTAVADLGCGIGIDAFSLARHTRVEGIDIDPLRIAAAQTNAEILGLANAVFRSGDYLESTPNADAYWADPARRTNGRRITDPSLYLPSLVKIRNVTQGRPLGVKVSPAVRTDHWPEDAEIEFISVNGDLKEAVFWFGDLRRSARSATVLPEGGSVIPTGRESAVDEVGAYVFDPDPAIVRAGALGDLAFQLDAWRIDERIAYLSGSTPTSTPFAQTLKVETSMPWNLKRVKRYLRGADARVEEIRKRGSAVDVDAIQRELRKTGERPVILILTRLRNAPAAIIASRWKDEMHGTTR